MTKQESLWNGKWYIIDYTINMYIKGDMKDLLRGQHWTISKAISEILPVHSIPLYREHKMVFENYCRSTVIPALNQVCDDDLLVTLVNYWENYKLLTRWVSSAFDQLEKEYVIPNSLKPLDEVAYSIFRDMVHSVFNQTVTTAVIAHFEQLRQEVAQPPRSLLRNVISYFIEVGNSCYTDDLEKPLLDNYGSYLVQKGSEWTQDDATTSQFLYKLECCWSKEKKTLSYYLPSTSRLKFLTVLRRSLWLLRENGGCYSLFEDDARDDLSRLYRLLSQVDGGLAFVGLHFKNYITMKGTALYRKAAEDAAYITEFVDEMSKLHENCREYLMHCFENKLSIYKFFCSAFDIVCHKAKVTKMLVSYIDNVLKTARDTNVAPVKEEMVKVCKLVDCLKDKNIFMYHYRRKLHDRLVLRKSDTSHERMMFPLFRTFRLSTETVEKMVIDMETAMQNDFCYKDLISKTEVASPGIDLSVWVLSSHLWSISNPFEFIVPEEMEDCEESYENFFSPRNPSKKIRWMYWLGTVNIEATFDGMIVELIMLPCQAAVVMLFNEEDQLSYEAIQTRLKMETQVLTGLLHSLSCGDNTVLVKEPDNLVVSERDYFRINRKFNTSMKPIRVPLLAPLLIEDTDIKKDRRPHETLIPIVYNLIKSRKSISMSDLVMECMDKVENLLKPATVDIKRAVERLIDAEIIARDPKDWKSFILA